MGLHLYCPTELAVLLLAVPDENGIFHFPGHDEQRPGLWLRTKPLLGINEQLLETAERELDTAGLAAKMQINQEFAGKLTNKQGQPATLYLATLEARLVHPQENWPTLPQLLSSMPKDRNRLAYLLAWQVLSGALTQMVHAVEVDEQMNPVTKQDDRS